MPKLSDLLKKSQGDWQCMIDETIHNFSIDLVDFNGSTRIHLIYTTFNKNNLQDKSVIVDQNCTYFYETHSDERGCIIETDKGTFVIDGVNETHLLLYKSKHTNDRTEATFRCKRQLLAK